MIKFAAFVVLVCIRIAYQPSSSSPAFGDTSIIAAQTSVIGSTNNIISNTVHTEKKSLKTIDTKVSAKDQARRHSSYEIYVISARPQFCLNNKVDKMNSIVIIRRA